MAEYTSIKITKELNEKMQIIKKQNNYKSINELLEATLDKTVNENLDVIQEQPLFYVGNEPISWTTLKKSQSGDNWSQGDNAVTVLFKDKQGVLLRFCNEEDIPENLQEGYAMVTSHLNIGFTCQLFKDGKSLLILLSALYVFHPQKQRVKEFFQQEEI